MSENKYDDRTTEEIRIISEKFFAQEAQAQKNKYRIPFIVVAASLVVLLVMITVNYLKNPGDSYAKFTEKDNALNYALESKSLKFEYDGKDLSVENTEGVIALLGSEHWDVTGERPDESSEPKCIMKLESDYFIKFYDDIAVIVKGDAEKRYKIESGIAETLCVYLDDNTYISIDDMAALLSVSENLTLDINGITCVTTKGQSIANALNTSTWNEIDSFEFSSEPFLVITDPIGLILKLYEAEKVSVVSYKGNVRYYSVDELVPASVALAAKTSFDAEAVKIGSVMESCDNLIVVVDGNSFRIDSNPAWIANVRFDSWTRRYKAPAAIPESADITVFDDVSFVLKIYADLLVAEYDNSYYNIPETVISSIKSYLTVDPPIKEETEISKFAISDFVSQITKQEHLHSDFSGKTTLTSVSSELVTALAINSWEEVLNGISSYDIVITTDDKPEDGGFVIYINTVVGSACIEWNCIKQYYTTPKDMSAVMKYIQNNVYTETWQISATELGALQNSATSIETVFVANNSEKKYLTSEIIGVSDIVKIVASMNLTPIENRPEAVGSEKTEMTFKTDTNKFMISYYKDSEGKLIVSVSGTLSDIGKRIERHFVAEGADYNKMVKDLDSLVVRTYDIVAGTFVEAIKSMDSETINNLTGNVFDYSNIASVKFNSIGFEKTSNLGKYVIKFNVAESEDGPFDVGESRYVLEIGSTDGSMNLKVKSLIKESEYNKTQIKHDAVSTADYFSSWFMTENPYFESFDKVESKKAAVDFLMLLALRNQMNTAVENDPMGMYFTPEAIGKTALKYFNIADFDAKETSAYNADLGLYSYTNAAVPVELKKVVDFEDDSANNRYYVTISWFEDPMYLYEVKTVVYTLDKSGEEVYRILSATEDKPVTKDESDLGSESDVPSDDKSDEQSSEAVNDDQDNNIVNTENESVDQ